MSKVRLSRRQKEAMYRDGFLILRKAVPTEMVTTARQLLNTHLGAVAKSARQSKPAVVREVAETAAAAALDPRLLDLFNKTVVDAVSDGEGMPKHVWSRPTQKYGAMRKYDCLSLQFGPPQVGVPSSGQRVWA